MVTSSVDASRNPYGPHSCGYDSYMLRMAGMATSGTNAIELVAAVGADLVAGRFSTNVEHLPTRGRDLNFRLTVNDNFMFNGNPVSGVASGALRASATAPAHGPWPKP